MMTAGTGDNPAPGVSDTDIPKILDAVTTNGDEFTRGDASVRRQLLADVRRLTLLLETPAEAIVRIAWAERALYPVLRIAVNLKMFEKWVIDGGGTRSCRQLAGMVNAEEALIGRMLKHFASMGVINEVGADGYNMTPFAASLADPRYSSWISFTFDCMGPVYQKLPEYIAANAYREPVSTSNGPFQYGHFTNLPLSEWLKVHPNTRQDLSNNMAGYKQGQPSWLDTGFFPTAEVLGKGLKGGQDQVLLVDVGGGIGHDVAEFRSRQARLPGRLILQDVPRVIEQVANLGFGIEAMAHDFFTPQPIKGARAYYLHSLLHDWTDEECRKILLNLVPAMARGYSKVLVNEMVVADRSATWLTTSMDWTMMALLASRERTEAAWPMLLASVGLQVVKIWTDPSGAHGLIEAELA